MSGRGKGMNLMQQLLSAAQSSIQPAAALEMPDDTKSSSMPPLHLIIPCITPTISANLVMLLPRERVSPCESCTTLTFIFIQPLELEWTSKIMYSSSSMPKTKQNYFRISLISDTNTSIHKLGVKLAKTT